MAKFSPGEYDAFAAKAILTLLQREFAAVWLEIEAKVGERPFTTPSGFVLPGIDTMHLTNARRMLLEQHLIEQVSETTRGGSSPPVLVLRDRYKRTTRTAKAVRRKRLLQARYLGWTQESKTGNIPNLIGEGGELTLDSTLKAAAARGSGYLLMPRPRGGIAMLFDQPVPGGTLDHAAYLTLPPASGEGPLAVTVLFEVKNIRHWIYPGSSEPFQLLDKAARLQRQFPNQHFVPVLVCRRAQHTAFAFAKRVGFFIYYTATQAILPHSSVSSEALQEVVDELGYNLVLGTDAHAKLTDVLCNSLPLHARSTAQRWARTAAVSERYARILRDSGLLERDSGKHASTLAAFREEIDAIP